MIAREQLRLLILQVLEQQPQYTTHQELLIDALKKKGVYVSREQLHVELYWLDNYDLLIDQVSGGVHIATLTPDGSEIAQGIVVFPGIARPVPAV